MSEQAPTLAEAALAVCNAEIPTGYPCSDNEDGNCSECGHYDALVLALDAALTADRELGI